MNKTTAKKVVAYSVGLALLRRNDRLAAAGKTVPGPPLTGGPASVALFTLRTMLRAV